MKISLLTTDGAQRHPISPRYYITQGATLADYPPPDGFVAVAYDPSHDLLPVQEPPPEPPTKAELLAQGCTHGGRTYDISEAGLTAWDRAAGAIAVAYRRGLITDATSAQSILGPILDINGQAVPPMTVAQLDLLILAIMQRVAQIRATA